MRTADNAFALTALLPRFMASQPDDVALAEALSPILRKRAERIEQMQIWGKVDAMDDTMMDAVAAALHIAWWKADWDVPTKREMLAKSEEIRLATGTKWALEFVLRKWFADETLQVQEWFDYGGAPYTFRILTSSPDVQKQLQFSRIMESIKRTSQSMDGIFLGFSMRGAVRIGAKGSESRTDHGQAMTWPYIPKGTRYTHTDALEEFLWESGQTGTDAARAAVADATGTGGVLTKDFPLIFDGDDTSTALPIKSTTRTAYQQAMASQWAAVGADIDVPAMSWVWPILSPGGGLAEGCLAFYGFPADGMSGAPSFESAVDGHIAKVYRGTTDITSQIAGGTGIVGDGIQQPAGGAWRTVFFQAHQMASQSDELTISAWFRTGRQKTEMLRIWSGNSQFFLVSWWYETLRVESTGTTQTDIPTGGRFVTNSWNHLVATLKAGEGVTLYVNGESIGTSEKNYQPVPSGAIAEVELGVSSGTHYADEVGVWNRALSAEEVAKLYQAGLAGKSYPFEGN